MVLLTYCLPALLFFFNKNAFAKGRRPRFEPLPVCSDCVSREDIIAAGVGIDLTTSYATAAVRFHDGSTETLAKSNADNEYKQMMVRVSDPSSKSQCRPGHWSMTCSIESARRRINKALGRPSTQDVGTIASLVQTVLATAQDRVPSLSVTRALITVPETPGLTYADLEDAMEHLGLTLVSTHKHIGDTVSELSAAYAGSNNGLCTHFIDPDTCEDEEADMPTSHVLALSLTHHSFSASYTYMSAAYRSILEASATRFDLGLDNLPSLGLDARYWSHIFDVVVEIGRQSLRPLTTLLLLGEDGENPDFLRTVQAALRELLPEASVEEIAAMVRGSSEPNADGNGKLADNGGQEMPHSLYLAARGAAEFAKRAQEAPAGCVEPKRCEENRMPGESGGGLSRPGASEGEGVTDDQVPMALEADGGKIELKT